MKDDLIIEKPEMQSSMQRMGWSALTFLFWAVYMYLWLPLVTLIAWWVGYKLFKIHLMDLQGYVGLKEQMSLYLSVICIISAILISWALVERMRFKNATRRGERPQVNTQQIALFYGLDEATLNHYRNQKSITIHLEKDGRISDILEYKPNE